MMVAAAVSEAEVATVSKSKPPKSKKSERKQFTVRLDLPDAERVETTAQTLGLDEANFLRMMVLETLPKYEKRAARIRHGLPPDDCDATPPAEE